jgi:hypothetical protein
MTPTSPESSPLSGMSDAELKLHLIRSSPGGFAAVASRGRWKMARHLELLNRKLVAFRSAVIRGSSPRLMISMPPRHGKSELTSKHLPPWLLMLEPDWQVILCSYNDEFAAEWGLKALQLFEEFAPPYFGLGTNPSSRAANRWHIDGREGGMRTAGVGSGITGRGGNVLIVDDSIKDYAQANSEVYRQRAKDWWGSTFYSRLAPGGGIILMQTRWHEDDLPGHVLGLAKENGRDGWEVLNLPALAGPGDPLGRQPGEALWPERYPVEALERIRANMSAYWWSALYQGSPQPAEGGAFKRGWLRYYRAEGELFLFDEDA